MKTIIANKNLVKKVAPKEGKTIQIGNARLTWKATGADTAYGTSLYEMNLAPGVGIPEHSHPYAEVFYIVSGYVDFLRYDEDDIEEWVRCGPGDTLIAGANALHAFHNRADKPCRFLSASVYYHEVALEKYGIPVDVNDPIIVFNDLGCARLSQQTSFAVYSAPRVHQDKRFRATHITWMIRFCKPLSVVATTSSA